MISREAKVGLIMAYDICSVYRDLQNDDLGYIVQLLTGEGVVQFMDMSDAAVDEEFEAGDYAEVVSRRGERWDTIHTHKPAG